MHVIKNMELSKNHVVTMVVQIIYSWSVSLSQRLDEKEQPFKSESQASTKLSTYP